MNRIRLTLVSWMMIESQTCRIRSSGSKRSQLSLTTSLINKNARSQSQRMRELKWSRTKNSFRSLSKSRWSKTNYSRWQLKGRTSKTIVWEHFWTSITPRKNLLKQSWRAIWEQKINLRKALALTSYQLGNMRFRLLDHHWRGKATSSL